MDVKDKHGRDKLFSTPELLWEAACEYFQWCDENPWLSKKAVQKTVPVKRKKGKKVETVNEQQVQQEVSPDFPSILPYRILYLRRRFIQMVEHLSYGM